MLGMPYQRAHAHIIINNITSLTSHRMDVGPPYASEAGRDRGWRSVSQVHNYHSSSDSSHSSVRKKKEKGKGVFQSPFLSPDLEHQ